MQFNSCFTFKMQRAQAKKNYLENYFNQMLFVISQCTTINVTLYIHVSCIP